MNIQNRNELKSHIIEENLSNERFLSYSVPMFVEFIPSRNGMKKAIKRGELLLNGEIVEEGRYLKKGDFLQLFESDVRVPKAFNLKLEILFEDDYLAVIKKPAGIVVSGNQYKTIVNALLHNLTPSTCRDALKWAKPVHRIDSQTSGLLLIAKSYKALVNLSRQFEDRTIKKKYNAIVIGKPDCSGRIEEAIDGRDAITDYKILRSVKSLRFGKLSLLELSPLTGRTHQIRIHLSNLGFPILGDKLYGIKGEILKHKGLFLSAVELIFHHPVNGNKIDIALEHPQKFTTLMNREERRCY